jgi:phosphoribosylformylglycinamidine synthase subunit PurQ / glutaminase
MKACVIVFPGSNCDRDVQVALRQSIGREPEMVWHGDDSLPACDLIVVPGGFSYGDYLRSGAMAAHSPVMGDVVRKARAGVPVLGICNGFQILTECGLLPGVLMRNAGLKFVCRDVHLRVETTATPFTGAYETGQVICVPIAHMDGNYFADDATLDRLEGDGRVAFRYVAADGKTAGGSPANGANPPANPNGSARDIAGVLDEKGKVLGMMPHPERLADAALGGSDGRAMFDGLVKVLG